MRGVCLFRTRAEIRIAQTRPKQIARGIDLRGFIKGGDRSLKIAGLHCLVGGGELLVQSLNRRNFLGIFGLRLLHLLQLLGTDALLLSSFGLRFLQIEVESGFVDTRPGSC